MTVLLLVPLLLPFVLPPLAGRAAGRVRPSVALWATTLASAALALGVVACLGALLLPLALRVPRLAALADLTRPLDAGPSLVAMGAGAPAAGLLPLAAVSVVTRALREARRLRSARTGARTLPHRGELCVLDDPRPDAYALPGGLRGAGRIVVTTGMLGALDHGECAALLAHERAHLAGRHHLFLAVALLAGRCHPALGAVVPHVSFAAERVADESAARETGDRRLTAHAVGRAALAMTRAGRPAGPPTVLAEAVGGPVPARVKALLTTAPRRRVGAAVLAMALLCTGAASSALTGAALLHREIEIAQGEWPRS